MIDSLSKVKFGQRPALINKSKQIPKSADAQEDDMSREQRIGYCHKTQQPWLSLYRYEPETLRMSGAVGVPRLAKPWFGVNALPVAKVWFGV